MNIKKGMFLTLLMFLFIHPAISRKDLCKEDIKELAFQNGEKLTYAASYKWGPIFTDVGEVLLSITDTGNDQYYVLGVGRTHSFYDSFFKVRDTYETRFSIPNMEPKYFKRDVNEGGYEMVNIYYFDWQKNILDAKVNRINRAPRDTIMQLNDCTRDVLTYFYYFRSYDFTIAEINQEYVLNIVLDDKRFSVKCRYLGKEVKNIKGLKRKVNCLKFAMEVVAGEIFKGNERIILWVSDDKNHIPLELESPIKVGKLKGRILSYENLKYPLNFAN